MNYFESTSNQYFSSQNIHQVLSYTCFGLHSYFPAKTVSARCDVMYCLSHGSTLLQTRMLISVESFRLYAVRLDMKIKYWRKGDTIFLQYAPRTKEQAMHLIPNVSWQTSSCSPIQQIYNFSTCPREDYNTARSKPVHNFTSFPKFNIILWLEVLTALIMESCAFWDIIQCSTSKVFRRLGGPCLHIQGKRISHARNQNKAGSKGSNILFSKWPFSGYFLARNGCLLLIPSIRAIFLLFAFFSIS
jgi:hypothetical protein